MIFSSRVHIFMIHIIINVAAAAVAHTRNKYTSYVCTECIGCGMFKLLLPQKIWSGVQCLQNWCGCRIKTVAPLLPPKNYCIYISMCGAIARYDVRAIHTDHIEAQSWQHHAFAKLVINENWKFSFKIIIFHHRLSKQNEKKIENERGIVSSCSQISILMEYRKMFRYEILLQNFWARKRKIMLNEKWLHTAHVEPKIYEAKIKIGCAYLFIIRSQCTAHKHFIKREEHLYEPETNKWNTTPSKLHATHTQSEIKIKKSLTVETAKASQRTFSYIFLHEN